ncbi:hypothetical protein GCM10009347_42750 [Shewanella algicola]|nr:hypothetical protein GCM10009347_42750 [Shewanella algicola]
MSRIKNNDKCEAVDQKAKAQKALGEQSITLTHRVVVNKNWPHS